MVSTQRDGYGVGGEHGIWKSADTTEPVVRPSGRFPKLWLPDSKAITKGHPERPSWFALCHSRTSTNAQGVHCAHPFRGKLWMLAHNGVVSEVDNRVNSGKHACDSARLHYWLEQGNDMEQVKHSFGGYGVVMAFNRVKQEIHIWRERAMLSWRFVDGFLHVATASFDMPSDAECGGEVPDNTHTVISRDGKITCDKWFGFAAGGALVRQHWSATNGNHYNGGFVQQSPGSSVYVKEKEKFPDFDKRGQMGFTGCSVPREPGILSAEEARQAQLEMDAENGHKQVSVRVNTTPIVHPDWSAD